MTKQKTECWLISGDTRNATAAIAREVNIPSERVFAGAMPEEKATLVAYLQRHALTPIDSARYPDLAQPEGKAFEIACSQCHAAPDPKMHTSREWPKVVERMQRHMGWANRVVGEPKQRTHPVLDTKAILRFLQRHARTA
jgi:hypothetical protein